MKWLYRKPGWYETNSNPSQFNSAWPSACGYARTVKSLDNTCHTWPLMQWWFTTKRRYI